MNKGTEFNGIGQVLAPIQKGASEYFFDNFTHQHIVMQLAKPQIEFTQVKRDARNIVQKVAYKQQTSIFLLLHRASHPDQRHRNQILDAKVELRTCSPRAIKVPCNGCANRSRIKKSDTYRIVHFALSQKLTAQNNLHLFVGIKP